MTGGRPLRFLALSLGGWALIRLAILLPDDEALLDDGIVPAIIRVVVPAAAATAFAHATSPYALPATPGVARPAAIPHAPSAAPDSHLQRETPVAAQPTADPNPDPTPESVPIPSPAAPPARPREARRLNGSAWLLARGGPAGTLSGGQLGASQGGVRLTYALGERRKVALAARLAAPLTGPGREAALGIEWQPTALPIRLFAEQRFVLDGGRGGPTLGVIAGYGPADIARGVRLEAYGQAGAIARDGIEGFVDASARVTHPIARIAGVRIDIGVGIWGSAQRAAERLDVGPSLVVAMPIAGRSLRLALDWRHRVAGAARPGPGPALSIGSDF